MQWLFTHIWIWCLLATLLGIALGWWLRGARARTERLALEADLASSRRAADDAAAARTRLENELALSTGRITPLTTERDGLLLDVTRLQGELDAHKTSHATLTGELERTRASLAAAGSADTSAPDAEIVRLRAELAAGAVALTAARSAKPDTSAYDAQIASLRADLDACRAEHASKDTELARLRAAGTAAATTNEKLPLFLDAPRGAPDDLKLIKGVGEKLNALLNGLGIFHFRQIANWDETEVAAVDAKMENFRGRITRDEWIPQSKLLAAGNFTEFERIYGKMGENN